MSVVLEGREVTLSLPEEEIPAEEVTDFEIVNSLPSEDPLKKIPVY